MLPLALRSQGGKVTELTPPSSFQSCSVTMYPAGPGSGDSPEGFPEQPRRQSQIGNCTAQTRGTERSLLLYSVVGQEMESGKGEDRIEEVWVAQSWWKNWPSFSDMYFVLSTRFIWPLLCAWHCHRHPEENEPTNQTWSGCLCGGFTASPFGSLTSATPPFFQIRGKGPLWNRMRQETISYVLKQGMDSMCDLNLSWGRELRKGEK